MPRPYLEARPIDRAVFPPLDMGDVNSDLAIPPQPKNGFWRAAKTEKAMTGRVARHRFTRNTLYMDYFQIRTLPLLERNLGRKFRRRNVGRMEPVLLLTEVRRGQFCILLTPVGRNRAKRCQCAELSYFLRLRSLRKIILPPNSPGTVVIKTRTPLRNCLVRMVSQTGVVRYYGEAERSRKGENQQLIAPPPHLHGHLQQRHTSRTYL